MSFKRISVLMLFFNSVITFAETPSTFITLSCPSTTAIQVTPITEPSWANYQYQAQIFIDFSPLNGHLQLSGKGTASRAIIFQAATWTDRIFLCNYNQGWDAIVIFETSLDQYVKSCYFENAALHTRASECLSSDPSQCLLICEVGQPES